MHTIFREWNEKTYYVRDSIIFFLRKNNVRAQLGFGRPWVNFARPMSNDRLLFAAQLICFSFKSSTLHAQLCDFIFK